MNKLKTDFQFLTENSRDMIVRVGIDLRYRYVSPASFTLLGWRPEEMIGQHVSLFAHPEDFHLVAAGVKRALTEGMNTDSTIARAVRKDKTVIWIETSNQVIRDEVTGAPIEFVIAVRDISERKAVEEKLTILAMTDGLTGLANRRAFDEVLHREWKRTLSNRSAMSLVLLDLDHFKSFNDQYGHQAGDDCLRAVANTLRATVRQGDVTARYGGEELAAILPETHSAAAADVGEKIRAAVEALSLTHFGNTEGGGFVTVSIGIATALSRDGGTIAMPEGLLLSVDSALYRAKHAGRNRTATTLLIAPSHN